MVPLPTPATVSSVNGELAAVLTLEPTTHTTASGFTLRTRGLNGTIPGPTLRIKAGDTLKLTFRNELPDQGIEHVRNQFSSSDESNVHFHGLHVSGELPSDDVTKPVLPGSSYLYVTKLPDNHHPGTHWLHPHRHGSTALQVGGGAALAVIVEDPAGSLPAQVEGAPEVLLVVQQMQLEELKEVARQSGDGLFKVISGAPSREFTLVNGEVAPSINVNPGEWTRFRIVYAGELTYI